MGGKNDGVKVPGPSSPTTNEAFLQKLDHPQKKAIEELRRVILAVDPKIREEVKWNAPSFYLEGLDHFVTFKLKPMESVQVVLHTGAKVRNPAPPMVIQDPQGLLKWAAADRCQVIFSGLEDIQAKKTGFVSILKQWIRQL